MILIVDDNQENIFSLKKLLELNKFQVHSASSGQEALKQILKNTYSLIILDVQMPEMDGFEVAEAISGYSKSKDIPIIFLSAINTHKKYITKGYESGGVDYVTKPFDPDLLLLKIKTFYRLSEQNQKLIQMDGILREEIEFRKQAENDLEQKVEELKSILESMPQMAFTTSRDGKIEFVNNHWSAYSSNTEVFPLTEGITISEYIKKALHSERQIIEEIKIQNLDSMEYRFHVLYLTPVRKGNNLIKLVGIFTDIHEQKMSSQILEKRVEERTSELKSINTKLESSNLELQKFAYVASHDLQEPLRKIQVFSDALLRKGSNKQEDKPFLEKIISSAERMRRLITDLLNYSLLAEKEPYQLCNLNTSIEEVLIDYELVINAKKAKISIGKIPLIEMVPSQVKPIFQNLISNALKFSKKDGAIEVSISAELVSDKSITSSPSSSGEFCRISVIDNGIGFDQQYGNKIFEIFQRLHQRELYEGTGIGLAVVKKMVENNNGVIGVTSNEREGTTFFLVLPLRQNEILKPINS